MMAWEDASFTHLQGGVSRNWMLPVRLQTKIAFICRVIDLRYQPLLFRAAVFTYQITESSSDCVDERALMVNNITKAYLRYWNNDANAMEDKVFVNKERFMYLVKVLDYRQNHSCQASWLLYRIWKDSGSGAESKPLLLIFLHFF